MVEVLHPQKARVQEDKLVRWDCQSGGPSKLRVNKPPHFKLRAKKSKTKACAEFTEGRTQRLRRRKRNPGPR